MRMILCIAMCVFLSGATASAGTATDGARLVQESGVQGGLIVHLGCGDAALTRHLRVNDSYLVQGLEPDPNRVVAARQRLLAEGAYGGVSIHQWDQPNLPYLDNLVNLLVVDDPGRIARQEIERVLCPGGVAYVRHGTEWTKTVKPWPDDIDDWTHALYDASGNAVSRDKRVGPPEHLQWTADPKWTRHHEAMCSFQALVSAKGRIFYILDEGPRASLFLPSDWQLIARDAFNGKILWKKKLGRWVTQLYNYKSGPVQMTRRLVTDGDRVYVVPGLDEPLHVLDAVSGKTLRIFPETAACEEILLHEGILYLMTSDQPNLFLGKHRFSPENAWSGQKKWLRALDAQTGAQLWALETPVAPLSFAVAPQGVVFHNGQRIVCLDRKSGVVRWESAPVVLDSVISTGVTPTLVAYQDVVMFIGGDDQPGYRGGSGHYVAKNLRTFTALSTKDGSRLWTYTIPPETTGFECPKDILVVDDLVWLGAIFGNSSGGTWTGRNVHTGAVERAFKPPWDRYWFHQRCYRSRATERYLLPSRTGIEFVSPKDGYVADCHWVRGACLYGTMPANGLMYAPPNPCGCYMESLLHGFNALAPAAREPDAVPAQTGPRLEKGPAFGTPAVQHAEAAREWPTYRHDAARSGHTAATVPAEGLTKVWEVAIGRDVTALTVADGKVFVADKDAHTLYARDAATGRAAWQFTAGARIDSPPTIAEGRVVFGCRDGLVYCLNAPDGRLVWQYRAAPADRRLMAYEQIESVWPVHGSVLVVDGAVYCIAGRSMFLDGGMRFLALDLHTGRQIAETVLDDRDPTTNKTLQDKIKGLSMPVANPDLLSYDGQSIYLKSQPFRRDGTRPVIEPASNGKNQTGEGAHLFCAGDLLDGSGFHRLSMIYGKEFPSGVALHHTTMKYAPGGEMVVFDDANVYGYARLPDLYRWTRELECHLFAAGKDERSTANGVQQDASSVVLHSSSADRQRLLKSLTSTAVRYHWSNHDPDLRARAMVLADKTLFVAGPPAIRNEDTVDALRRWQGQKGGILWSLSATDGVKLSDYRLQAPPVWDGMAAAYGRLYLSLTDGTVTCYAPAVPTGK